MRVLDIADDLGAFLKASLPQQGVSTLVKTAEWREPATLRPRDFAVILVDTDGKEHGKYACFDPGNTIVSMLYLEQAVPHLNPAAIKTAASTLSSMAQGWGIPVPLEIAKLASLELSPEDRRDIVDARRVRYNPPKIASSQPRPEGAFAKLASASRGWADLDPFQRREVAHDLVKEAATLPLSIPEHFYRYAGDELSPKFASYMRERLDYVSDPEVAEGYRALVKIAGACEPDSVVTALYQLDDLAQLRWSGGDRYGEKIADPVRCVYDMDKKAAFSWNHGADATNENELWEFVQRPRAASVFLGTFTDDLWERFKKDPVGTFRAMPREQKALASRMAREV